MSSKEPTYSRAKANSKLPSLKPISEDLDVLDQQSTQYAKFIQPGHTGPNRLNPRHVLQLQRTHGNRAVQRLMRLDRKAIKSTLVSSLVKPAILQRQEIGEDTEIRRLVEAGTLSVAVYTAVPGVEREFQRAAQSFAEDHRSVGVRNGRLVVGSNAAFAATSTGDVVTAVNNTIAQVRRLLNRPEITVDTLALFAHGVNASRLTGGRSYLNLTHGHQITNAQQTGHNHASDQLRVADFANQITAALGDRARVVLYACELGDSFYGGENDSQYQGWNRAKKREAQQGALADELSSGDTSFADELRDLLNATGAHREVWGHRTTGHTTANPTWRHFGSGTETGAENLFGEEQAQPDLTPEEGWNLKSSNIQRARNVVRELVQRLQASPNIPARTLQALDHRGHGLSGWIARELPFAPAPFVEGDPPTVRDAVVQFLERQAGNHEPSP